MYLPFASEEDSPILERFSVFSLGRGIHFVNVTVEHNAVDILRQFRLNGPVLSSHDIGLINRPSACG